MSPPWSQRGAGRCCCRKRERPAELEAVQGLAPGGADLLLIGTIETAHGVTGLPELLRSGLLGGLGWGPYDLAADMGLRAVRNAENRLLPPIEHARSHMLVCAGSARTIVFDTVTAELADPSIIERDALESASLGFRGKFCIHPAQVEPIRRAFMPTEAELARCHRMLAAAEGRGAFLFERDMVDEPMLQRARHILARAEQRIEGDNRKGGMPT